MRAGTGFSRRRWAPGIVAVGMLAIGFTVAIQSAVGVQVSSETDSPKKNTSQRLLSHKEGLNTLLKVGPGVPVGGGLRVLPPVKVDYRKGIVSIGDSNLVIRNSRRLSAGSIAGSSSCANNIECDDCNPCTLDACATATCSTGPLTGSPCGDDTDCKGVCVGGDDPDAECVDDLSCCGSGATANGTCQFNTCLTIPQQCVNFLIPTGQTVPECDDGLECNGRETCTAGVCGAGTPLCTSESELVCIEADDACVGACLTAGDCDDGSTCNGDETCDPKTCEGGATPDVPCQFNANCDTTEGQGDGVCGGGGTGLCVDGPPPCGPGAGCDDSTMPITCSEGRCCTAGACTSTLFADCAGGTWLATDDACEAVQPSGSINDCPEVGSGINPQDADFSPAVGPFSISACKPLSIVGDDYTAIGDPGFMDVELLRFALNVSSNARVSVEFYDTSGSEPILIENVFVPDGTNFPTGFGPAIFTADFDPPLTIPKTGIIAWTIADDFGPSGQVSILAANMTDVGLNDTTKMFINGAVTTGNFLGECAGGSRAGQWCNVNLPADLQEGCPGGTCADVPDVLAFEIIASPALTPAGACCNSDTGICSQELPWICRAEGNVFSGGGCDICSNTDPFADPIACNNDAACKICIDPSGDDFLNLPCGSDLECGPSGVCEPNEAGKCASITQCKLNACCNPTTGVCDEVEGGLCSTAASTCDNDEQCPTGETCEPQCPGNGTPLGFGSDCVTGLGTATADDLGGSCCVQPTPTGGDNCSLVTATAINIPAPGDPSVSITVTGNNSTATFDEFEVFSNFGIFDPNGGTQDPGWWEGFELVGGPNSCADVRIDLCCSSSPEGEPLRPAWGFMLQNDGCPGLTPLDSELALGNDGVAPPLGVGVGTSGFARGGPFCDEDNLWQTFSNLGPGRYFYPLYSAPNGTFASPPGGNYQFHITVSPCEIAACCNTTTGCQIANRLECDALDGFLLTGIALDTDQNVVTCGTGTGTDPFVCDTGACCKGPGDCEDRASPEDDCDLNVPSTCITKAGCDTLGGDFNGGGSCSLDVLPCPACESELAGNCKGMSDSWYSSNDYKSPDFANTRMADDFIAEGPTATEICVWGGLFPAGQTFTPCDVIPDKVDWIVRFYEDDNGLPGTELIDSPGLNTFESAAVIDPEFTPVGAFWQRSITFPPVALEAGKTYWLEFAGGGVTDTCIWWNRMGNAADTNNLYYVDGETYDPFNPDPWLRSDRSGVTLDLRFCIDSGLTVPEPRTGACCQCDGNCFENALREECEVFENLHDGNNAGGDTGVFLGTWWPNQTCAQVGCVIEGSGGGCPGATATEVDDCVLPGMVFDGRNPYRTRCASSDGQIDMLGACDFDEAQFFSDVWFEYTATCDGRLEFDMCGADDYDGILAVYQDPITHTAPGAGQCPPGNSLLVNGTCSDGLCPSPTFSTFVTAGDSFLIRIGGEGTPEAAGEGVLRINCETTLCPPVDAVTAGRRKLRYLAFSAGNSGLQTAVRVTMKDLPPPFDIGNSTIMWVGEPKEFCQNSGQNNTVAVADCGPSLGSDPNLPGPTWWMSTLVPDPFFTDWSIFTQEINIKGDFIVPSSPSVTGTYILDVMEENCDLSQASSFSEAVEVLQPIWGDAVGLTCLTFETCSPPDGVVGITSDVSAILEMFKNSKFAPGKPACDVEPAVLDDKINFTDVVQVLDAFGSKPYPFSPAAFHSSGK